eukprot:ctg_3857.g642
MLLMNAELERSAQAESTRDWRGRSLSGGVDLATAPKSARGVDELRQASTTPPPPAVTSAPPRERRGLFGRRRAASVKTESSTVASSRADGAADAAAAGRPKIAPELLALGSSRAATGMSSGHTDALGLEDQPRPHPAGQHQRGYGGRGGGRERRRPPCRYHRDDLSRRPERAARVAQLPRSVVCGAWRRDQRGVAEDALSCVAHVPPAVPVARQGRAGVGGGIRQRRHPGAPQSAGQCGRRVSVRVGAAGVDQQGRRRQASDGDLSDGDAARRTPAGRARQRNGVLSRAGSGCHHHRCCQCQRSVCGGVVERYGDHQFGVGRRPVGVHVSRRLAADFGVAGRRQWSGSMRGQLVVALRGGTVRGMVARCALPGHRRRGRFGDDMAGDEQQRGGDSHLHAARRRPLQLCDGVGVGTAAITASDRRGAGGAVAQIDHRRHVPPVQRGPGRKTMRVGSGDGHAAAGPQGQARSAATRDHPSAATARTPRRPEHHLVPRGGRCTHAGDRRRGRFGAHVAAATARAPSRSVGRLRCGDGRITIGLPATHRLSAVGAVRPVAVARSTRPPPDREAVNAWSDACVSRRDEHASGDHVDHHIGRQFDGRVCGASDGTARAPPDRAARAPTAALGTPGAGVRPADAEHERAPRKWT